MKSSHLIGIALACITLGAAIPARADNAVVNESNQTAIITGSGNSVNQSNNSTVRNSNYRGRNNTGTSVRNQQTADVMGNNNTVNQSNRTNVDNRNHPRR